MLKEPNFFRDILFALALIGLIRIVYQQRNEKPITQSPIVLPQTDNVTSSTEVLLETTQRSLNHALQVAQQRNDIQLQEEVKNLQKQFVTIQKNYYHTTAQEDALTVFLGPIYTASKITKERLVKKQLASLKTRLTLLMKEVRIHQGKTSSQMKAVLV